MKEYDDIKRFAIAVFHNAGDIICCTPVAKQLKADDPNCHITWFTSETHSNVLNDNPYIDDIVSMPGDPLLLDKEIPLLKASYEWEQFFTPAPYMNYKAANNVSLFELIKIGSGLEWTIPFIPVLRLTQEEKRQTQQYVKRLPAGVRILVETEYSSEQSHWHEEYVWDMLEALEECNPVFIFSALNKPAFFDKFISAYPRCYWYSLPLRTNAELFNQCDALIGVSSGISAVTLSDYCRTDIPRIEVSRGMHWSASAYPHLEELRVCFNRFRFKENLKRLNCLLLGNECATESSPDLSEGTRDYRETNSCPTCGLKRHNEVPGKNVVCCDYCKLIFHLRNDTIEGAETSDPNEDHPSDHLIMHQEQDNVQHIKLPFRETDLLGYATSFFERANQHEQRALDIREARGTFLFNAREDGVSVVNYDLPKLDLNQSLQEERFSIGKKRFNGATVGEETADAVLMYHSLENERNPFEVLEKIQFMLKKESLLLCRAHNYEGFCSKALKERWHWIEESGQSIYFSPRTLCEMIVQAGFNIESCITSTSGIEKEKATELLKLIKPGASLSEVEMLLAQAEKAGQGEIIQVMARKRGSSKCRWRLKHKNQNDLVSVKPGDDTATWISTIRAEKKIQSLINSTSSDLKERNPMERDALSSEQNTSIPSTDTKAFHIVIDGVIFQLQANRAQGISRVWQSLIPELVSRMGGAKVTVLRRSGSDVSFNGVNVKTIPAYRFGNEQSMDADDEMLGKICRELEADIFISTYYSRSQGITNLVMVHDLIPEVMGFDLSNPEWVTKRRAIETGDAFTCISEATRNDLHACYPHTIRRPSVVAYCGRSECFQPASKEDIERFRRRYDVESPFLLMVGNRSGYKNARTLLQALAKVPDAFNYTIVSIGGEKRPSAEEAALRDQLDIRFIGQIADSDLAAAYSGAEALLYPSTYEGFGLPPVEAMACGCPVVAMRCCDAIFEVCGNAIHYLSDLGVQSITNMLRKISDPSFRRQLVYKGKQRAALYSWNDAATELCGFLDHLYRRPAPLLTAIVSTYNDADFIEGCLNDLVHQTVAPNLEIIVIDSASEQRESDIIREFQRRNDNIKYIRTSKRENVYEAWNRGIKFAAGKYITNANTDDRHRRDALEFMVRELEAHPDIVLAYADVVKTEKPNETFNECTPSGVLQWYDWDRRKLLEKGCFIGPQPVWRRDVHNTYGYFDPQYTVCGDFEFWLRISQTNSFLHISKPLGLYLERPDSVEHRNLNQKNKENSEIIARYRSAAEEGRVIRCRKKIIPDNQEYHSNMNRNENWTTIPMCQEKTDQQENNQGGTTMPLRDSIMDAIEYLIEKDQKDAAFWILDQFMKAYPKNAKAHYLKATAAFELNDLETALQYYEKAAALGQDNATIQKSLGDIYFVAKKDARMALAQYQQALYIDPNDVETLMTAGHLSVSMHQFDQARQYYNRVLKLVPDHVEAKRYADQLPANDDSIPLKTISADELYRSAEKEIEKSNPHAAVENLLQIVSIEPENARAHNDLGVLYYEMGDKERALQYYEKACELMPENVVFQKNLAEFFWNEKNDAAAAIEKFVQVLKLEPQDIDALLGSAQICMSIGKMGDANDFIECALEIEPWNSDARELRKLIEGGAVEENNRFDGDALYTEAQNKAASGDRMGAIGDLNRLVERLPDHYFAYNDLGVLHYETGDKEKALFCYQKAYELASEHPNIIKNLADFFLLENNNIEEAMTLYIKVLEKTPEDVECLMASALVCTLLGKTEDAAGFYQNVIDLQPWNQEAIQLLEKLEKGGSTGNLDIETIKAAG